MTLRKYKRFVMPIKISTGNCKETIVALNTKAER